ncbi:Clr5 domain-containing protein [Xylaria bambusicola]|uniref:Clr5 domain-containing protein n=1 Tax=Xylaria bambusicola TaxID=326684 RepID=UPI00200883EE|nr:Clr5 domain-containing protein [Xylaria bambusicola]KAI0517592.1 Clr5 domain-containing protein [Xylaria bambusicola]
MTATKGTSIPWAQDDGWDKHRTTIMDLYIRQRKTLEEVKQIMEDRYGFRATGKMYKTRFKKWNIMKNKKQKKVLSERFETDRKIRHVGDSRVCSQRGQLSKRATATDMKKTLVTRHNSSPTSIFLQTQPTILSMAAPDFYKAPEDSFRFTQVYHSTVKCLHPAASGDTLVCSRMIEKLAEHMTTAKMLCALGYKTIALRLVDMCCHMYKSILTSRDLSAPHITGAAIIALSHVETNAAKAFLCFISKMSQIVLGGTHPLSILFHKLAAVGVDNMVRCIAALFTYYLGAHKYVGSRPYIYSGEWYRDVIKANIINVKSLLRELQPLQRHLQYHLQQYEQGQPDSQSNLAHSGALRCRIAWIHYYAGNYKEATEVASAVLNGPEVDGRVVSGCGCYEILYGIAMAEENYDRALELLRESVEASAKAYGHAHSKTAEKMERLESHLRSRGQVDEADEVRRDLKSRMEQICEEIQRLRLGDDDIQLLFT